MILKHASSFHVHCYTLISMFQTNCAYIYSLQNLPVFSARFRNMKYPKTNCPETATLGQVQIKHCSLFKSTFHGDGRQSRALVIYTTTLLYIEFEQSSAFRTTIQHASSNPRSQLGHNPRNSHNLRRIQVHPKPQNQPLLPIHQARPTHSRNRNLGPPTPAPDLQTLGFCTTRAL